MSMMDPGRLAAGLGEQTTALARTVAGADPGRPVPTCPEWTVRDLVEHVGQSIRWSAELVESRSAEVRPPLPPPRDLPPPRWAGWLEEQTGRLVRAVEEAAGETVWTPLGPGAPAFWLRRTLHDALVHHADAALTVGAPYTVTPALAEDAIDEGLGLMAAPGAVSFRPELAALRGRGETLLVGPADDGVRGWLITRVPTGFRLERRDDGGDAALRGLAADLVLVLTRRIPLDHPRVEVTGDRRLFEHWLANTPL